MIFKKIKAVLGKQWRRFKFARTVNWYKTIYFNYKMFPKHIAKKLPVFFYGAVKFNSLEGHITIHAEDIKRGMIGFGQNYEMNKRSQRTAEITLDGQLAFKGHCQFGKDYFINIMENAYCEMGHMSSLGSRGKIICSKQIVFGEYARIGYESQLMDTNFHAMINTETQEKYEMEGIILLGNYNYFGNRVSIYKDTKTPNFTTIASHSVLTRDYTKLPENILIGGIPAELIKTNISRDWEGERDMIENALMIDF
ncbi:MAG: transferase [Bacteroidota bacterium]